MCMFLIPQGSIGFLLQSDFLSPWGVWRVFFVSTFFVATSELSLHCSLLRQCVANQLIITPHSIILLFFGI